MSAGSMHLIESGPPKQIVLLVWTCGVDEHPDHRRFCAAFGDEDRAYKYILTLQALAPEDRFWCTDEYIQ